MSRRGTSLAEIMGSIGASQATGPQGLSLDQLPMILGDAMPELPRNAVGRHRLIRALQQRFGASFRSLPGVMNLVQEFDTDIAHSQAVAQMGQYKGRR